MKFFIFVNRVSEEEEKKLLFILLLLFISELATQIFTHTLNYLNQAYINQQKCKFIKFSEKCFFTEFSWSKFM